MMQGIGIIERAYQLAGECRSLDELKAMLKREGYASIEAHLGGGSIRADLKKRFKR